MSDMFDKYIVAKKAYINIKNINMKGGNTFFSIIKDDNSNIMDYYNLLLTNIEVYKENMKGVLLKMDNLIQEIIKNNTYQKIDLKELETVEYYQRLCLNNKMGKCKKFRYKVEYDTNNILIKDIVEFPITTISEELKKIIVEISELKENPFNRKKYIDYILLCLNFENIYTILLYKENLYNETDIQYEPLLDSQKK